MPNAVHLFFRIGGDGAVYFAAEHCVLAMAEQSVAVHYFCTQNSRHNCINKQSFNGKEVVALSCQSLWGTIRMLGPADPQSWAVPRNPVPQQRDTMRGSLGIPQS